MFGNRYARRRDALSPAFQRVAAFIDAHRPIVMTSSAIELARRIGTSDATVVRAVQALGFDGLRDLRSELAASFGPRNAPIDNLQRTLAEASHGIEAALDGVLEAGLSGLEALRTHEVRRSLLEAVRILHAAQRIVVFGLGPTAHVAAYFTARLRRKGRRYALLDRTGAGLADQLLDLSPADAILMMAYGKPCLEAELVAAEARRHRIPIVLVTGPDETGIARHAKVTLAVPRGQSERVALYGATVSCLEMLLLGLAASDPRPAIATLAELERLRHATRHRRRDKQNEQERSEEQ